MLSKFLRSTTALLLMAVVGVQSPTVSLASSSTTFSGQATALKATVAGTTLTFGDTGRLPSSGGSEESSLLNATVPGQLSAEVLHATTVGQGDRSRSEASVASVSLTVGGQAVSADLLMAKAMAVCTSNGP